MRGVGGDCVISLVKAKRLKELGLKWKPKIGDAYILHGLDGESVLLIDGTNGSGKDESTKSTKSLNRIDPESLTWLPSLSQLLAEIANKGWDVGRLMIHGGGVKSELLLRRTDGEHIAADWSPWFTTSTPEDAAASALIWILEQEASQ